MMSTGVPPERDSVPESPGAMSAALQTNAMDVEHLQCVRDSVRSFLSDCARRFDGSGRLLDICSSEHERAATHFRQAQITTLDSDPHSDATYIGDLCTVTEDVIPSGSMDWIVCAEVLAHVSDPFAAVRQIYRLLKPGGYGFITTPFDVGIHGRAPDRWRFTEQGLRTLLKDFVIDSLEETPATGRE